MVRDRLSTSVAFVVAVILMGILAARLGSPVSIAFGAPLAATPADQLAVAADKIEAATAKDGGGFTFTVVSRSMLHAKPDGPLIEIPDPIDRYKSLGFADHYDVGGSIAEGIVSPDGYFLQMRAGPATLDAPPDFEKAQATLAALVVDGKTYRNDGEGWYPTDQPPGIGLDVATIERLPSLLREATAPKAVGQKEVDGATATTLEATGTVENAPGLMAVDAAPFTVLVEPLDFAFDAEGRLVEIHAVMRNTNMDIFHLLVDTVVTLSYPEKLPALPEPSPRWSPPDLATEDTP
jgi:hypothetical protein